MFAKWTFPTCLRGLSAEQSVAFLHLGVTGVTGVTGVVPICADFANRLEKNLVRCVAKADGDGELSIFGSKPADLALVDEDMVLSTRTQLGLSSNFAISCHFESTLSKDNAFARECCCYNGL